MNQIVEKLANLQINVQLPENAFAPTTATAPVMNVPTEQIVMSPTASSLNFDFDSDKIGKMLQDVVVTQSKLYQEMAKATGIEDIISQETQNRYRHFRRAVPRRWVHKQTSAPIT